MDMVGLRDLPRFHRTTWCGTSRKTARQVSAKFLSDRGPRSGVASYSLSPWSGLSGLWTVNLREGVMRSARRYRDVIFPRKEMLNGVG
jgi:hypothetical protein